jgi:drug/metabolite transporter (DMT)-like permease
VSVALALASAVVFGGADFVGGLVSRRAGAFAVTAFSQFAGALGLLVALPLLPGSPDAASMLWGAAAGLAGVTGLTVFFHALAIGPMSVVSPLTAVTSAALPLAAGLALGEQPSRPAVAGLVLGVVAVLLASRPVAESVLQTARARGAVRWAIVAGAGFALFFVLLAQPSPEAGLWPLLAARTTGLGLLGVLALAGGRGLVPHGRRERVAAAASGVLDMTANVCYLLAVQSGLLSVTAVLASLYPVSTVVLARVVLGERLATSQRAGVALALLAVGLVAAA